MNVQAVVSFEGLLLSLIVGAEGSASDSRIFTAYGLEDVPEGCYLLGDAGFGIRHRKLLTPYRKVRSVHTHQCIDLCVVVYGQAMGADAAHRYHLSEYVGEGASGPQTAKELFNLRHSSSRMKVGLCQANTTSTCTHAQCLPQTQVECLFGRAKARIAKLSKGVFSTCERFTQYILCGFLLDVRIWLAHGRVLLAPSLTHSARGSGLHSRTRVSTARAREQ